MMRCCFIGNDEVFDEDLDEKIVAELEKLVQMDDEIEFLFYNPDNYGYEGLCLFLSIWLRTKYPHKSIKIVRIFFLYFGGEAEYDIELDNQFPRSLVDKNFFVPGGRRRNELCDYMFFYSYPNFDRKTKRWLNNMKADATVIHLASEKTEALIQETITLLPEQHQRILQMTKEGQTQNSIAQTLGVSSSVVRNRLSDTEQSLQEQMKKYPLTKRGYPKGICALMSLGNPSATSTELTLFECTLIYLFREDIIEFWIDEDSLQTPYGVILARAIDYKNQTEKVNSYERRADTDKALTLKTFPNTLQGYKDAIKQSKWVLTDYTHSQAETIKTLCREDGRTLLVDIGSDRRKIEKYPN